MKVCSKCKETRSIDMFGIRSASKDGLNCHCKICSREYTKSWKKRNPEKHNASNRLHYSINSEYVRAKHKEWKQVNASVVDAHRASYRAAKLCATPAWLTKEHTTQIKDFYWLSKDLTSISGQPYHVDHIVPLQGDSVCGLHVPWNLQVLPSDINISKSNSFNV